MRIERPRMQKKCKYENEYYTSIDVLASLTSKEPIRPLFLTT